MEYLGTAESMLLLKVLKEEGRWKYGAHAFILKKLSEKLSEKKADDSKISMAEFEQAYQAAMTEAVSKMSEMVQVEIKKEYEEMQRL
jgi:hypothetical protein